MLQILTDRDQSISSIATDILSAVKDPQLSAAIASAFESERASIRCIENVFMRFTQRSWERSSLVRFFAGWRDTHLTSGSVSALICRLLTESEGAGAEVFYFLNAAQSAVRIIHEDLGLVGETHHKLFERLANRICAGDAWKLNAFRVESAHEFSQWVHQRRIGASLEDALATTIASEIYNHGEYTFIAPLFKEWIERFELVPREHVQSTMAYILVHTGSTESDHFLNCIEALEQYQAGCGRTVDYERVTSVCQAYLQNLCTAFSGIDDCLGAVLS